MGGIQKHFQMWILLENGLDYPVNVFLCASRGGTSIAICVLEWSHVVFAVPRCVVVEWFLYRCPEHNSCHGIEAFWVLSIFRSVSADDGWRDPAFQTLRLTYTRLRSFAISSSLKFVCRILKFICVLAPFIASDCPEIRPSKLNT